MKTRLAIIAALAATAGMSTGASAHRFQHLQHQPLAGQSAVAPVLFPLNKAPSKVWKWLNNW